MGTWQQAREPLDGVSAEHIPPLAPNQATKLQFCNLRTEFNMLHIIFNYILL